MNNKVLKSGGTYPGLIIYLSISLLSKPWGDRLVADIGEYDVRQLINSLQGSVSPSHQKNMLKYIKAVMDYAFSRKYVSHPASPRMKIGLRDKLKLYGRH